MDGNDSPRKDDNVFRPHTWMAVFMAAVNSRSWDRSRFQQNPIREMAFCHRSRRDGSLRTENRSEFSGQSKWLQLSGIGSDFAYKQDPPRSGGCRHLGDASRHENVRGTIKGKISDPINTKDN